jgi:hypothetical protein
VIDDAQIEQQCRHDENLYRHGPYFKHYSTQLNAAVTE